MGGTRGLRCVVVALISAALVWASTSHLWAQGTDELAVLHKQVSRLRSEGKYAEAIPLAERYVALARQKHGEDHRDFATAINWLASVYQDQGRYAEAEPLHKRFLAILEKVHGVDHPLVCIALNNIAALYEKQGRYAEAEPLYQRSLAIQERALRPDDPDVGRSLNGLAALYKSQGRFVEAEPLYKRAVAIFEKALGPDHPDVGASLNNLALLYENQGRYAEAEPLHQRSLGISEKALGPDHPMVGQSLNSLALLYRAQGRYAEAEPLYKRSLGIREKALGPDHPDVGQSLNNLAVLYSNQGRYAEAEPLYKHSLAIREKALGPDHPDVGNSLNGLALLYERQGRHAEAEPLYKRSLAIGEKALGPEHPSVGGSLNNLAGLYRAQGRYAEAESLFKRYLAILEKAHGLDHPSVATALSNLAVLYWGQGRHAEAEPLQMRSLAIREKVLGSDHPDVGASLSNLAGLYWAQDHYAEAEPLYKRSLGIREKALGPDHPDVAGTLNDLAVLAFEQRDWLRAADYWRRSTAVLVRRAQRGTADVGQALTGKRKGEAERLSHAFWGLVKVAHRLATDRRGAETSLQHEVFQAAQWARGSEAAASLAQMAARGAKGDPKLAALIRERQDLVEEWQTRDGVRSAAVARPPEKRDHVGEAANVARLASIDTRIGTIDQRLAADFPDYAALARPVPLTLEEAQAQLGANEALVLFLDTPEWKPTPEETFVWAVTRTDVRWVRSSLGTPGLIREVAALRCGLDAALWDEDDAAARCRGLVSREPQRDAFNNIRAETLPFDLARAHALYKTLFGEIEDLIRGKHLLIVPSGPLTQLPFQVLVSSLPTGDHSGLRTREVGRIGADLGSIPNDEREQLQLKSGLGVRVVRPTPGGPAEAAGVGVDDLLLSVDGVGVGSAERAVEAIRAHKPGTSVSLGLLRDGNKLEVRVTLGSATIEQWIPRFLDAVSDRAVAWLARSHAMTVQPAVSSLKALRRVATASAATKPMLGIGNPLLDGNPAERPWEAKWAQLARDKQACPQTVWQRVAGLVEKHRGVTKVATRSGRADLDHLRSQMPLHDTADELCAVAKDLKLSADDILLGARATEAALKKLSGDGKLANYRVLHFATHGTIAGEIEGTNEPGLILTPPKAQTEEDDGYLSASEVAALKLDADWVILSACNTAAGGAQGAEALSGLARAFIYAGTRALLVSHWSVSSEATVSLITSAVGAISQDKKLGRAEALRRAMLATIDKGKPHEAHPAYWAPFIVVGEGAAGR